MLKPLLVSFCLAFLGFHGCQTVPTPPAPSETKTGPALNVADLEFKGRIEAQGIAAAYAANTLPPSNGKTAVEGPVGVINTLTSGASTQKQRDEAMAPVLLALQGRLQEASAGWAKAQSDADAFKAKYEALAQQVAKERVDAAAELTRQLQAARDEERAKARASLIHMVGLLFFGGGALCLLATAGVMYFSVTVPQLGPRVAIFTGGAGVVLIGSGLAIIELLNHPAIIWWGLSISLGLLACAATAIWYNHLHAVKSGEIAQVPAVKPVVLLQPTA